MEYGFSSQAHMVSGVLFLCACVQQITRFSYLDEAAFSRWHMGRNLTKIHNTTMAFIAPTMAGREPSNTNKKAFTVHPNADKL